MLVKKTIKQNDTLTFAASKNNANIHLAEGDNDVTYKITNVNGTFKISADGEVIAQGLKGYARAVDAANKHYADNQPEPEPAPVKRITGKSANGKSVTVATTRQVAATPAKNGKGKKVAEFPDYAGWVDDNPEPAKKRGEALDAYKKRVQSHKLAYGRAKAAFNRENGLTATLAAKTVAPKAVKAPADKEEIYGERWNDFGEADTLEYELSRCNNAYASVAYSIEHGKVHPHSEIAANSYFKAVERAYTSEARLMSEAQAKGWKLPKDFECRYFRLTLSDIDDVEQSALSRYIEFYEGNTNAGSPRAEWANKEAKQTVKGKVTLNAEGLILYPLVSAPKKRMNRK